MKPGAPQRPLRERLLWFAGLWIAGVACVSGLAYLLRAIIVG